MDEKYTNIKERLLYFAKNQSIGIEKFLENIGMTYGSFKGKAKEGSLNSNAIVEIYTKYPQINIEWLLTGNGPMIKVEHKGEPPDGSIYKELSEARKEIIELLKKITYLEKEVVSLRTKLEFDSSVPRGAMEFPNKSKLEEQIGK